MGRLRRSIALVIAMAAAPSMTPPVTVHADGGSSYSSTPSPGRAEDPDFTAAVKAIKGSDYKAAIPLLQAVVSRDARNADAYNLLGFSTRKAGDVAGAIPIYQKALALDPKHRGAHEYIGEAYLQLDDPAKAKQHLATLNSLCFLPCSEYTDLKKAVETYEKTKR